MTVRGWDVFVLSELLFCRNLLILLIEFEMEDYCEDGTILSHSWESICVSPPVKKRVVRTRCPISLRWLNVKCAGRRDVYWAAPSSSIQSLIRASFALVEWFGPAMLM